MVLAAILALVGGAAREVRAAEWGGIGPGTSTRETVRAQYGEPSRSVSQKLQGYATVQWTYEGARAPAGMERMIVDFGLLTSRGYRPGVVRTLTLEPKPGIFTRRMILIGWGQPTGTRRMGSQLSLLYAEGLIVEFDADGNDVRSMLFTPPQPIPKGGGERRP